MALQVTTDPDHKFDLSLQLDDLDGALAIARSIPPPESDSKWKAIGDRALAVWRFDLARECFEKANDLSALLLLLLAVGDRPGLERLSADAGEFLLLSMPTMGSFLVLKWKQLVKDRIILLLPHYCNLDTQKHVWTCC